MNPVTFDDLFKSWRAAHAQLVEAAERLNQLRRDETTAMNAHNAAARVEAAAWAALAKAAGKQV